MKQALSRTGRYGPPALLVLVGAFMLFAGLQAYDWIDLIWPVLIILAGLPPLYLAWHAEADQERRIRLIYPGTIITGTGLLLQYQLITGHWHSWTYAWALYGVAFGLGLLFEGRRTGDKGDVRSGRMLIGGGLAGFVVMALVMEMLIFSAVTQGILSYVLGGLLVGGGLVWGGNRWRINREPRPATDKPKPESASTTPAQQSKAAGATQDTSPSQEKSAAESLQERRERLKQQAQAAAGVSDAETPDSEAEQLTEEPSSEPAGKTQANQADTEEDAIQSAATDDIAPQIDEYKPPEDIKVDGEEPSAEIDPDLKARIDAALSEDDEK